jgi:hypothetical protein
MPAFEFPNDLSKMTFRLDQRKILFQDSLHHIGGSTISGIGAHYQPDSMLYFDYLVQEGIIDCSYEDFYPRE